MLIKDTFVSGSCGKKYKLEPPKHRPMNDVPWDDFVAVDFETMTPLHTSACAIGMVKVIDGEIVQQFYTLINPIRDPYTDKEPCRGVHGISLESAEKALPFDEIFEGVKSFIGGLTLVCHNKAADMNILRRTMEAYGLEGIDTTNVICTYELTGLSLSKCCAKYGIPETNHHNALWDAEVCARVYLELIGKPLIKSLGATFQKPKGREVKKEHRGWLDESLITNADTVFYKKTVVITGTFDAFPERDDLAEKLQSLGARVTSGVTKRTDFLIVGQEPGYSKLNKMKELLEEGCEIVLLREHELMKYLHG